MIITKEANLKRANLKRANLKGAKIREVHYLTFDQLSRAKTLYYTKIDEELYLVLNEKYPALFEVPEP